jgi:acetylglutamate kinase
MSQDNILATTMASLGYVRKFRHQTILIKLGGAALQDPSLVHALCEDLSLIHAVGINLILVHGGGPSINKELTLRGIQWEFVDGLRVTTPEMMEVIEMVLCGQVNHRIVRALNKAGVRSIGLSGADASLLQCKQADPRLQQVGTIEKVDTSSIQALIDMEQKSTPFRKSPIIPVIAPVGVGSKGEAYNINADWAASRIAEAMKIKKVFFLTDQDGILNAQSQLISELDAGQLESLIEQGVVKGGMLAKTQTILYALRHGVKDVHIINARRPHGIIEELFTDRGVGTVCRLRSLEPKRNQRTDLKAATDSPSTLNRSL